MEVLIDEFILFYFAGALGILHILSHTIRTCEAFCVAIVTTFHSVEFFIYFAPGQETTSTLLTFTTGLLIQHPDILQRLS